MAEPAKETIQGLLMRDIPRALLMRLEEGLLVGAQRAYRAACEMDEGHLAHAVGQQRHFHMNEGFQRALSAAEASPSPIRGNGLVTGRAGVFTLARFNIAMGCWNNGRRSNLRRQMSKANWAIEPLAYPDFFRDSRPPSEAVVFFVACFSGSVRVQPESPLSIQVAVPDGNMRGWLFREPLEVFVARYNQKWVPQRDVAIPVLKKGMRQRQGKDGVAE